jgi:hypothetical protein
LEKAENIELQFFKDEVKKYKRQELSIKTEMEKLKKDSEEAMKRLVNIEKENEKIKNKNKENDDNRNKTEEMLKSQLENERERHLKEIESLKNEINSFSAQLKQKNVQIRSLNERSAHLEHRLKEKDEHLAKVNQELIMTVAHCEALRLENHFIKQSLCEKKSDEKDVVEMQNKYHHVLDLTEKENKRLKGEIVKMSQLVELLKANQTTTTTTTAWANHQNKSSKYSNQIELDQRRSKILKDEFEKQIDLLKIQHEVSIKRLSNEIEKLHGEKHALLSEIENKHHLNHHQYHGSSSSSRSGPGGSAGAATHFTSTEKHRTNGYVSNGSFVSTNSIINEQIIGSSTNSSGDNHSSHLQINLNKHYDKDQNLHLHRNNIGFETAANYKFDAEPNLFQEHKSNQRAANTEFINSNFEKQSNQKAPRLSISSQLKYDEQKRKKDVENLLENHIEILRRSSANEHAVNFE